MTLSSAEAERFAPNLLTLAGPVQPKEIEDRTINQDLFEAIKYLPPAFVDLLFVDPPYNLNKEFNSNRFKEMKPDEYENWVDTWMKALRRLLKPTASIYVCGDWKSSDPLYRLLSRHFVVRNRITWEREKGRGAKANWKNCSEDIWFATVSDDFTFDVEAAKLKRKVIAPYRDSNGNPKDWTSDENGSYRITHPSNLWTDVTVPFWSMAENTDHPTQKPEKLLAKIILASSKSGEMVFDPFLGSGTTSVVAKKLGRRYCGVEIDRSYCLSAEKRLELAQFDSRIQGYSDGVFWERNSLRDQVAQARPRRNGSGSLF